MAKTYIPTLLYFVRQLCLYITRYRMTISEHLPPTATVEFEALAVACDAFLVAMTIYDNLEP